MSDPVLRFERVGLTDANGDGVSLDVPGNVACMILGSEATGVDALGRFALGLLVPPSGRVLLYGEDIATMTRSNALAFRRRAGYLPADIGLIHNLSLRDNVALPLRYGSSMTEHDIAGRLRIILAQLRLTDVADQRPADVREEQRRRTGLARALAFDPALVIMEDPFDGLTMRAASEFLEIARGGETDAGARRCVFITGQSVPQRLEARIEMRFRIAGGQLHAMA